MNNELKSMLSFYKNKTVFVTGHTGFKGSWLCCTLIELGANVIGYSLSPPTTPSLFVLGNIEPYITHINGDVRNYEYLLSKIKEYSPEILIHLAAQPIVSEGYSFPRETFEINIMGVVNVLEAVRHMQSVKSVLIVTTDKVYRNLSQKYEYQENNVIGGIDPYSSSKSCDELIVNSYKNSYFNDAEIAVSTARAGNVIGGGDFSKNRLIPDCVQAVVNCSDLKIRQADSIRPYQHVLDVILAYLLICYKQYSNLSNACEYNVGPMNTSYTTTIDIVNMFFAKIKQKCDVKIDESITFREEKFIMLNCSKIQQQIGWNPIWNLDIALEKTIEWTKYWIEKRDVRNCMKNQIKDYLYDLDKREVRGFYN